jgi:glutamyl-tRNA synthetase
LAKRHGDTRLAAYREAGVSAERVIGLLAAWSGVSGERRPMSAAEFAERFELERLGRGPVTFNKSDHAWLMGFG